MKRYGTRTKDTVCYAGSQHHHARLATPETFPSSSYSLSAFSRTIDLPLALFFPPLPFVFLFLSSSSSCVFPAIELDVSPVFLFPGSCMDPPPLSTAPLRSSCPQSSNKLASFIFLIFLSCFLRGFFSFLFTATSINGDPVSASVFIGVTHRRRGGGGLFDDFVQLCSSVVPWKSF